MTDAPRFHEAEIQNEGCWLPSPEHCLVTRELRNTSYSLDEFIAALRAAAEGLESPRFSEYWPDDGDGPRPTVMGFRVMTPDDQTETMRLNEINRRIELEQLQHLQKKYAAAGVSVLSQDAEAAK